MAMENRNRLRFRPAGRARKHGELGYSPLGTGCPAVERAVAALYQGQNEESFWTLMNALNYALQLETRVLMPLAAAPIQPDGAAPWAEHPVPAEKAGDLPPWTLRTQKGRNYLPVFTSVQTAESDKNTAARPMAEFLLEEVLQKALDTAGIDGVVIDPWNNSATLECSLINGLLHVSRVSDEPGEEELEAGHEAAAAGHWEAAADCYEKAAALGHAEALTQLGKLLYTGRCGRRSPAKARQLWKKAGRAGDVLALVALGDDCAATGQGSGAALRYYRQAQKAALPTPDIGYQPEVELRLAQHETRYTSRRRALSQLAEARQGFAVRLRAGDTAAQPLLDETEQLFRALLEEEKA